MTHYGLLCPASTGHWNTILPLGKELQQRGHRVTLVSFPDAELKAQAAGLEFQVIGEFEFPVGTAEKCLAKLGELTGIKSFFYSIQLFKNISQVTLKYAATAIKNAGIEALLIDQTIPEAATIIDICQLPYITICSAVVLHQENTIPPFMTNWQYNPTWWGIIRNKLGYYLLDVATQPMRQVIDNYHQENNLPKYSGFKDIYSPLAQISQQPAELEFPRQNLPQWFHFTGPYSLSQSSEVQ